MGGIIVVAQCGTNQLVPRGPCTPLASFQGGVLVMGLIDLQLVIASQEQVV